ncbi:MAG: (d)CMP kinase [Candidatus Sericytochromatia bacterium]
MIVAIDGPAGAGKSSVAKEVGKKLGLTYIDTGAMYRALTYKALENNIDISDGNKLEKLLNESEIELVPNFEKNILNIILDKNDITDKIRTPEISQAVSEIATHKKVREIMVYKQRYIAEIRKKVIMDGRDIGTVVFPEADVKIFLTASVIERAKRRAMELESTGINVDMDSLIKDIKNRDKKDSEREVAPLRPADDAIIVDTTELNYEEVILKIADIIEKVSKIKEKENNMFFSNKSNDLLMNLI